MIALYWDHFLWFWGLTSGSEWPYLLWSGAGSDLLRLALIAAIGKHIQQTAKHHHEIKEMHERHHREIMGQGNELAQSSNSDDGLLGRVDLRAFPCS